MRLPGRVPAAGLRLVPAAAVRPTDVVTATVVLDAPVDRVAAARVELGYENTYAYRWAGRRSAAFRHDDGLLTATDQVGTDHGSERDTTDWVAVLEEPLPVADGVLAAGEHAVPLRIPSWAPGSPSTIVRWVARLRIERGGRDVERDATIAVRVAAPDPPPRASVLERVAGSASAIDLATDAPSCLAGGTLRGAVTITPHDAVPAADVAVSLQRVRLSHPLERTPADERTLDGRPATLDARLALEPGVPATLPFALEVPADADPTTEAVHSSIAWYVVARVMYAGFRGPPLERVRREVLVGTAPG